MMRTRKSDTQFYSIAEMMQMIELSYQRNATFEKSLSALCLLNRICLIIWPFSLSADDEKSERRFRRRIPLISENVFGCILVFSNCKCAFSTKKNNSSDARRPIQRHRRQPVFVELGSMLMSRKNTQTRRTTHFFHLCTTLHRVRQISLLKLRRSAKKA